MDIHVHYCLSPQVAGPSPLPSLRSELAFCLQPGRKVFDAGMEPFHFFHVRRAPLVMEPLEHGSKVFDQGHNPGNHQPKGRGDRLARLILEYPRKLIKG